MAVRGGKAKKAAVKSVLTERQLKWFASVEASLERDTGKSLAQWVKIAKSCPETTTGKRTKWLREHHGLGVNRIAHILSAAQDVRVFLAQGTVCGDHPGEGRR